MCVKVYWIRMGFEQLIIRSYEGQSDRTQVEDLERRCEVGPGERVFLFTDTMGDPICRIRNSPMYKMLVQLSFHFHSSHISLIFIVFFAPLIIAYMAIHQYSMYCIDV